MDILLLNSVNMSFREVFRDVNSLPPLGLLYVAAAVREWGHFDVRVIDFVAQNVSKPELEMAIADSAIIGISGYADSYGQSQEVAAMVKAQDPQKPVVMGGAFPTFSYEAVLRANNNVDVVVLGEGEITFFELTKRLLGNREATLDDIAGIAYRKGGEVVRTACRPPVKCLDTLPFPARDLLADSFQTSTYSLPFSMHATRGCPGNCIFCSSRAFWGGKVRVRSAGSVFSELVSMTEEYGTYTFHIVDDTFTAFPPMVTGFCDKIKASGAEYLWSCESRADAVSHGLLRAMYDAGCKSVQFGIESSNAEILRAIGKKITPQQIEKAIRTAHEIGFYPIVGSFMLGHYLDTLETMRQTMDFCRHLRDTYDVRIVCALNTPFPGTYQYENLAKLGMTMHTKEFDDLVLTRAHVSTKNFTLDDLRGLFFETMEMFG